MDFVMHTGVYCMKVRDGDMPYGLTELTSPCTSGRWFVVRLLSRDHRSVRGWVSDIWLWPRAYTHHAGFWCPTFWRVWGHVLARWSRWSPPHWRKALWCVARLLSRAHRCATPRGGVWWAPGTRAPHPSHRRYDIRTRHWCAVFVEEPFLRRRAFLPVDGALRKFAVASRLCSVGLVVEGRVCPCLNDHVHRLGCGLSRRYDLDNYALGVYITVTIFGHIVTFVGCLFFDYVPQGRCSHIQHRNCQWARVQFTFNLRVRGDSHACGEGSAL